MLRFPVENTTRCNTSDNIYMTYNSLKDELEKLRSEINTLASENTSAREKLDSLITDIEKKLDHPADEDHHTTLIRNLKDAIAQFETQHPRATAILNDIMVTLSNMGI